MTVSTSAAKVMNSADLRLELAVHEGHRRGEKEDAVDEMSVKETGVRLSSVG